MEVFNMFGSAQMFGQVPAPKISPMVPTTIKKRWPLSFAWHSSWNYVRETLRKPTDCEPGEFRAIRKEKFAPAKEVVGIICCPRGTRFGPGKIGCVDKKTGRRVATPVMQSLRHEVTKFKFRHPDVWAALMAQPERRVLAAPAPGRPQGWYMAKVLELEPLPVKLPKRALRVV